MKRSIQRHFMDGIQFMKINLINSLTAIKPSERQHFSTTVGPELLILNGDILDSQARPSRDFKRTQKVIRTFSQSNLNSDPSAKVSAALKDKPKKIAFRPAADYDYYDDQDSILSKSTSKVIDFRAEIMNSID